MEHDGFIITGPFSALIFGLILGLRHSTDADHIVAVSTISRDYKSIVQGLWVGISWGIGHSTPLIILGLIILLIKESFINFYAGISHYFEIGVAVMLILLGIQVFWKIYRQDFHSHTHKHNGQDHVHVHGTHIHAETSDPDPHYSETHPKIVLMSSFFRFKSFAIGVVHGLAGSAAVIIAMLPASPTFTMGFIFLIMFALGTMLSMGIMTIIIAIPFTKSQSSLLTSNFISIVAGFLSIGLGLGLGSDLLFNTSFIWY